MLIDKLDMAITAQQNAEIIKPIDNSLKLYPIHEKDRHRYFFLANMVEEDILKVLFFLIHLLKLHILL